MNFLGSDKRKNNNIESGFKQNKKYKDILLDILGNKATPANQAGRNQMLKGNLKPFFTIHDIIIPKKDINELWK